MTSRGFRTGTFCPILGYGDQLSADKLGFQYWLTVFQKQFYYFS
jgi:hypothetical protein